MSSHPTILGLDPGSTTGWCWYSTEFRSVLSAGQFAAHEIQEDLFERLRADHVVIERPRGYGPTRPQLVECGWIAGRLLERVARLSGLPVVHELTRLDVCQVLTTAVSGEVRVRNDATAWAALQLLHGGDTAGKKGGPLYGVKAHERAALAVAVAWALRGEQSVVAGNREPQPPRGVS